MTFLFLQPNRPDLFFYAATTHLPYPHPFSRSPVDLSCHILPYVPKLFFPSALILPSSCYILPFSPLSLSFSSSPLLLLLLFSFPPPQAPSRVHLAKPMPSLAMAANRLLCDAPKAFRFQGRGARLCSRRLPAHAVGWRCTAARCAWSLSPVEGRGRTAHYVADATRFVAHGDPVGAQGGASTSRSVWASAVPLGGQMNCQTQLIWCT